MFLWRARNVPLPGTRWTRGHGSHEENSGVWPPVGVARAVPRRTGASATVDADRQLAQVIVDLISKKKTVAKKPAKPSVESQIEQLRNDMNTQIEELKQQLADRDRQLQKAQQSAAAAQASAAQATDGHAQSKTLADTRQTVNTLDGAVADLKTNTTSLVTTIQDDQTKVKAAIESPAALHYKGITLTPGGFVAAETMWRSHRTGADIPTPYKAFPYENATAYHLSEFYGTARQSSLSLLAEGEPEWGTMRGYYEADFLGTGTAERQPIQ